jgi:hypothetical protein
MNKGGQSSPQGTGMNPQLAALFGSNRPASPGGMPTQTPQILAPQIPNIGMPPRAQMPIQTPAAAPAPMPQFRSPMQLNMWREKNPGQISDARANSIKGNWSRARFR